MAFGGGGCGGVVKAEIIEAPVHVSIPRSAGQSWWVWTQSETSDSAAVSQQVGERPARGLSNRPRVLARCLADFATLRRCLW